MKFKLGQVVVIKSAMECDLSLNGYVGEVVRIDAWGTPNPYHVKIGSDSYLFAENELEAYEPEASSAQVETTAPSTLDHAIEFLRSSKNFIVVAKNETTLATFSTGDDSDQLGLIEYARAKKRAEVISRTVRA